MSSGRVVRRGSVVACVGVVLLGLAACGSDGDGGGASGAAIKSVTVATKGGDFSGAIDATLSADGEVVYFTATSSKGPGVFRVPAAGGEVVAVATGSPFQKPVGVATDGMRLYIADAEAGQRGAILSLPVGGGQPVPVAGTEGTAARGLEVVREGGAEVLYFTGRDLADGQPGVFKLPAGGATAPALVAKGAPLASPDAVAVAKDGVVYATDRGAGSDGVGGVYRIAAGQTNKLAAVRAPVLAGVTLTLDDSTLLVSALSDKGTDEVLVIDLASGKTSTFDEVIGENRSGAGLHRARDVNVFAWADLIAGPDRGSRVYVLRP